MALSHQTFFKLSFRRVSNFLFVLLGSIEVDWGGFRGRFEPELCCNVMVEATAGFRLDPTLILEDGVNGHMGLPLLLCRWGADFIFWGVDLSLSDVVMSWLRLQQASDWHPTSILDVCKMFWKLEMV